MVRRIHRENPAARILVTGCYAQRAPEELASLPGVKWVVGNTHKQEVAQLISSQISGTAATAPDQIIPLRSLAGSLSSILDSDLRSLGSVAASEGLSEGMSAAIHLGDIAKQRQFLAAPYFGGSIEDRTRPNLKVQDGCNNRCSFCIIPSVRGLSRSLPPAEVVRQIRALTEAGYREVVLSGVNLGQYGRDLPAKLRFVQLLKRILDETSVEKLRLSSVEPMDFTDRLLDLMASTPHIAKHVHAPLQSGSDRVLRRMHRKYRAAQYRERILAASERMPEAAVGADVIVGFPGESDADFAATRRLVEELPFTYLHVFPFSRRPGTPAGAMKDQVNGGVSGERGRILRELVAAKNRRFRERHVGRTMPLLTMGDASDKGTLAITDNYLKVRIAGVCIGANEWVAGTITGLDEASLVAKAAGAPHAGSEPLV
jgi:threonylcarbamoyladenosine tRNA methylthiotransferase MtaB